ncbi:hypothetical protein BD309DRAFT_975889 [Dichomitus squalens]|nr:hypothetical protein BD309DRAFT_975889 [Dichomitus squalens]
MQHREPDPHQLPTIASATPSATRALLGAARSNPQPVPAAAFPRMAAPSRPGILSVNQPRLRSAHHHPTPSPERPQRHPPSYAPYKIAFPAPSCPTAGRPYLPRPS